MKKEALEEYQKTVDSINGSIVQAYKTLKKLKDGTFDPEWPPKMGILIDIDKHWKRECLESLYGDEDIVSLIYDDVNNCEWELELLLRRKKKKALQNNK